MFKILELVCYIHVSLELSGGGKVGFGSPYKFTFH